MSAIGKFIPKSGAECRVYDANRALIEQLSLAIELWEEQAEEFAEFNRAVADKADP